MEKRRLALWTFVAFALLALAGLSSRSQPAHASPPPTDIPLAMLLPPVEQICNYTVVFYDRNTLLVNETDFNTNLLDVAQACGTKVIVRLHQYSWDIAKPEGGLDLVAFEDKINDFAGLIDPYINNGTIIAHLVLDEPHDCDEWNNVCPTQAEADQAARISKNYWPTLPTMINTIPDYAANFVWINTDNINFTYAYHKGPLSDFVANALAVYTSGGVRTISWGIQATGGGCSEYGVCSMTPSQVIEVGTAMCGTGVGTSIRYGRYNDALLNPEMRQAVNQVRTYCGDPPGPPPTPFSLTGAIYQDYDRDRVHDAGEQPIPNVRVTLTSSRDGTVYSAVSNSEGIYTISTLAAGDYVIAIDESTLPPGHLNTGGGSVLVGKMVVTSYDFPVRVNALSGLVYRDNNSNSFYDAGDSPYVGVRLNLTDSNNNLLQVTTTDSNGQYVFRGLPSGTYTITVDPTSIDSGWTSVPAFRTRTVNPNSNFGGLDFAIQPPTNQISGIVFFDTDKDGQYTLADTPLPGVQLTIQYPDSSTASAVTDGAGHYIFTNLGNGTYTVTLNPATLPTGYFSTRSAWTLTITGGIGFNNAHFPVQRNSITGRIFLDTNRNRVYDANGDLPYANAIIELRSSGGALLTATSNATGNYEFAGIQPGSYTLSLRLSSLPPGYNTPVGPRPITVQLTTQLTNKDFPVWKNEVGGRVFRDVNRNRVYDQGDSPLPGVTVRLVASAGGATTTVVTGSDGMYRFSAVVPGSYTISLDEATLPPGTSNPKGSWAITVANGTYKLSYNFWIWQ